MKSIQTCTSARQGLKFAALVLLLGPVSGAAYAALQTEMYTVSTDPTTVDLSPKTAKKTLTFTLTPTADFTADKQAHVRLCGTLAIPGIPSPTAEDNTAAMKILLTYFDPKPKEIIDSKGWSIVLEGGTQIYRVSIPLTYNSQSSGDRTYMLGLGISSPQPFGEIKDTCTDLWKIRRFSTATVKMQDASASLTIGEPTLKISEDARTVEVGLDVVHLADNDTVEWTSGGARKPIKMQRVGKVSETSGQHFVATLPLPLSTALVVVKGSNDKVRSQKNLTFTGNVTLKAAEVQPLNWAQQSVYKDGLTFRATVSLRNTVKGDSVIWRDVTDDAPVKAFPMTETAQAGTYTVDIPVPTRLGYTARVIVKNSEGPRGAVTVVNGPESYPELALQPCTATQCIIRWGGVIPYRNDKGSLGINLKTDWDAYVKGSKAPAIFAIQPDSRWQDPDIFPSAAGAKPDALLSRGNTTSYFGADSSLFSNGVMPHLGAFTLNFEPVSQ